MALRTIPSTPLLYFDYNPSMASITFDTLKFAQRLKEAGVPDKQAEAEAEALAEVFQSNLDQLPTKSDLDHRLTEMEARLMGQITLVKWMLALVIIVNVVPVLKTFLGGSIKTVPAIPGAAFFVIPVAHGFSVQRSASFTFQGKASRRVIAGPMARSDNAAMGHEGRTQRPKIRV